jgi:hypothetical protein
MMSKYNVTTCCNDIVGDDDEQQAQQQQPLRVFEGDDEEEIAGGAEAVSVAGITGQDNSIPRMEAANNAATRQVGDEANAGDAIIDDNPSTAGVVRFMWSDGFVRSYVKQRTNTQHG